MNNKELAAALRIVKVFVALNGHERYNEDKSRFICFAVDNAYEKRLLSAPKAAEVKEFIRDKIYPEGTLKRWAEGKGMTVLDEYQLRHEYLDKWIKELDSCITNVQIAQVLRKAKELIAPDAESWRKTPKYGSYICHAVQKFRLLSSAEEVDATLDFVRKAIGGKRTLDQFLMYRGILSEQTLPNNDYHFTLRHEYLDKWIKELEAELSQTH